MSSIKLVICEGCSKEFSKLTKYVNAANRKGRKHYCSLSCQATHKNLTDPRFRHNENLKKGGKTKDEYSDFRWIYQRCVGRKKCNLDIEDIKNQWDRQNGLCALSGLPMKLRNKNITIFEQASLDRIDSSKPYQKDNIQFVILSLNYAKSTASNDEFKKFLQSLR